MAAWSQAIIIDNFDVPYQKTLSTGTWVDFQTDPSLLTGERDVEVSTFPDFQQGNSGNLTIENGNLVMVNQAAGRLAVQLEYNGIGDEIGNTGENHFLINNPNPISPFPSGTDRVRFHIAFCDAFLSIGAALFRDGQMVFAKNRLPGPGSNIILDIPYFPSAFDQCDSIVLSFLSSAPNSTLVISKVELVPEPSTLGALLAGGAGFLGLRKRAKR